MNISKFKVTQYHNVGHNDTTFHVKCFIKYDCNGEITFLYQKGFQISKPTKINQLQNVGRSDQNVVKRNPESTVQ